MCVFDRKIQQAFEAGEKVETIKEKMSDISEVIENVGKSHKTSPL